MKGSAKSLRLATMYLNDTGLFRAHGIAVTLERSSAHEGEMVGSIHLDPNLCGLDLWGDRTMCTKMASMPHPARAVLMRTHDEKGLGRRHWQVDVDGIDVRFHLIEHARAELWYLVAEGGERGTSVLPLFPVEWFQATEAGCD